MCRLRGDGDAHAVVAPALAGNRELMGDAAGFLVEPRDDAAAYAAAIGQLISDAPERERLGREGRERVLSEFTIEQMATRTLTLRAGA